MKQQNEWKRKLWGYMRSCRMGEYRLAAKRDSDVIRVLHWPHMQGQGVEAAGWMEVRWAKLVAFAKQHGFRIARWNELPGC